MLLSGLQQISYAPGRALVFLLTTPYFNHFLEQCVTSYPSALDDNVPFFAKVVLLLVAGFYEYLVFAGIVGTVEYAFFWVRCFFIALILRGEFCNGYRTWPYHTALVALLILSFGLRAKSFIRSARQRSPQILSGEAPSLWTMTATMLWFNPAGLYYIAFSLWSHYFSEHQTSSIKVVSLFWMALSPASQIFNTDTSDIKSLESKDYSLWRWSIKHGVILQIKIMIFMKIVSSIPKVSIWITFFAQSFTYWRSERNSDFFNEPVIHTSSLPSPKSKRERAWKLVTRIICSPWNVINACFSIIWVIGQTLYTNTIVLYRDAFNQQRIQTFDKNTGAVRNDTAEGLELIQSGRAIRLLRIRPGFLSEPMQCELLCHKLQNLSSYPYTAVSYSWGDDILRHEIEVNNRTIRVTSSAFEVLRNLRSHVKPKTIWIDALCIKQECGHDKNLQIPLMSEIYENASQTVIWLGQSASAALAIGLVNRIFLLNRLNRLMGTNITCEISHVSARALQEMLNCRWYKRAWVVQEVVRSKHSIIIRYGEESLSWQKFSWFSQAILRDDALLDMISKRAGPGGLRMTALRNLQVIKRFCLLVSPYQPLSLLFYLSQMLRSSTRFETTKPKDRVYALLGLSGIPSGASLIPNYGAPERQLYIDVARALGSLDGVCGYQLDFLMHAGIGYGKKVPYLPSWVPDWSLKTKALPIMGTDGIDELLQSNCIDRVLRDAAQLASFGQSNSAPGEPTFEEVALKQAEKAKNQLQSMLFNATRGTLPSYRFQPNEILELRGHKVDRIRCVGQDFPAINPKEIKSKLYILGEWARMVQSLCPPVYIDTTTLSRECAFLHTICTDFADAELDLTFMTTPRRSPYISRNVLQINAMFNFLCNIQNPARDRAQAIGPQKAEIVPSKLLAMHHASVEGRNFGITERGFMGLFLAGTKPGDVVSVFHGVKVPFSMRSVQDAEVHGDGGAVHTYELVGPAYVHGIMDGELMARGWERETFRLK